MVRLLWMVAAFFVVTIGLYHLLPGADPAVVAAQAQARHDQRQAEQAERLAEVAASRLSPVDKALAHAEALDPTNRGLAEAELSAATVQLIDVNRQAREAYPMTDAEIPAYRQTFEPMRAAARQRWEAAMLAVYGPTWQAYQDSLGQQVVQAGGTRFGYPSR